MIPGPILWAAATTCVDKTGGVIKDSVVVRANTGCTLENVSIRGGVTFGPGGSFVSLGSEIRGSVTGSGVAEVVIYYGTIRGSLTLTGGVSYSLANIADIRGDVTLTDATDFASLDSATVRSNVTVNGNTNAYVYNNTIGGNPSCANNDTFSNLGLVNTVGGTKSGDCAGL